MKIYFSILALLLNLSIVLATDSQDNKEAALRPYFKNPSFVPTGPFSEEKGYEVYLRLKYDKHLDDNTRLSFQFPTYPLPTKELQDELNNEIQKYFGISPNYMGKEKYPVMPEELYHDLFKIGCYFLHLAGEREDQAVSDIIKSSEKWFYRAAIHGHVYAWYGLGLIWLMDKSEEGSSSASYYLSILASDIFRFPAIIIKNKDIYKLRAIETRNPDALIEQSSVEEDKQEYQKMLDLLTEAHQLGSVRATCRLGSHYYCGIGLKAFYTRLLEGEHFLECTIALTKENDRIYSFDSEKNIKKDVTEECNTAPGIVPNKELAYELIKEAADKGYIPAILDIRNLFKKLEYIDPLSPTEEIKPLVGFEGTFIDFLSVLFPNRNGDYRIIENIMGVFAYASVYSASTERWSIRSGVIDGYLHRERDRILEKKWQIQDLEKKIFEEVVFPKIYQIASQSPSNITT